MQDPVEGVRAAHDFLNDMDWELVEEGVAVGVTTWQFLRRHPWIMVAAGTALSAVGGWYTYQDKKKGGVRKRLERVRSEYTPAP